MAGTHAVHPQPPNLTLPVQFDFIACTNLQPAVEAALIWKITRKVGQRSVPVPRLLCFCRNVTVHTVTDDLST